MADLEALKRAAEAASITRVTWFADDTAPGEVLAMSDDICVSAVARVNPAAEWVAATEAAWTAHIALANPATILDLISRLEEAEMALEAVAKLDVPRPVGTYWRADCKPTKNDKCAHGVWMYEECGECISDFAHAAHRRLKGGGDEA